MLKIAYAGSLGLSPSISSQFSVEMCAAFENCENSLKKPFSIVQGRSRSSMLINLKSLSPVLVMISSMSVSIYNRFHTIRADIGKITSFRGFLYLTPSFEGNARTQGHEILSRKTRDLEAAHSENFAILHVAVWIQCQDVTDGRRDRRPGHG